MRGEDSHVHVGYYSTPGTQRVGGCIWGSRAGQVCSTGSVYRCPQRCRRRLSGSRVEEAAARADNEVDVGIEAALAAHLQTARTRARASSATAKLGMAATARD